MIDLPVVQEHGGLAGARSGRLEQDPVAAGSRGECRDPAAKAHGEGVASVAGVDRHSSGRAIELDGDDLAAIVRDEPKRDCDPDQLPLGGRAP